MLKKIMQQLKLIAIIVLKVIISVVPKDKRLIMFSAWNGQKYADSPMYMYEYLLPQKEYKVFWYTKNESVYDMLRQKQMPVIYSKSLKGIWYQIRAIMLVSSIQLGDYNPYLLSRCVYYDLGHGFPIKESGFEQPDCTEYYIKYTKTLRKMIRYYMASSSDFTKDITCRAFEVRLKQIVFCTFPRTDIFFDSNLRKEYSSKLSERIQGKTVISYLPTHRSMGKVKIECNKIFDFDSIQRLCEEYNAVFLIKKHFFHNKEKENTKGYTRIIDITGENVETQTLLCDTNILVTDYSACAIDYSILDRPIVYYAYDLNDFLKKERNMYFPFEDNDAGYKSYTSKEFTDCLKKVLADTTDLQHTQGRKKLRERYFDPECPIGHAREDIKGIIPRLIDNTYTNKWEAAR